MDVLSEFLDLSVVNTLRTELERNTTFCCGSYSFLAVGHSKPFGLEMTGSQGTCSLTFVKYFSDIAVVLLRILFFNILFSLLWC